MSFNWHKKEAKEQPAVGDYLENVGKCTKRLGANAYPHLYGGNSMNSVYRGNSPEISGYATPSKEVQKRFDS